MSTKMAVSVLVYVNGCISLNNLLILTVLIGINLIDGFKNKFLESDELKILR